MLFRWFSAKSLPPMSQPSYRRELAASATFPVAEALVEGNFIGVVATLIFGADDLQLGILFAAPMFANLSSFLWTRWAEGRDKVRFAALISIAVLICIAGIGFLPPDPSGIWPLIAVVVLARCGLTGIITLRSTIWRHNYPRHVRGQITSRLAMVSGLLMLVTPQGASKILDTDTSWIHWLYPIGAAIGLIGVLSYMKIRMRGRVALMRYETNDPNDAAPNPRGVWAVLRSDRRFRTYMTWMFFGGFANIMLAPVVIKIVAERAAHLDDSVGIATALTHTLPSLLMLCTFPLWAKLLDRVHVASFRVRQGSLWIVSFALMYIGVTITSSLLVAVIFFGLGRVVLGICFGGGKLAWQLGHHDFAQKEQASAYMGAHVTLTGIRGAVAPLTGLVLLNTIGEAVFLVAIALASIAVFGFWRMSRSPQPLVD
jgi:MFS family permease